MLLPLGETFISGGPERRFKTFTCYGSHRPALWWLRTELNAADASANRTAPLSGP
jgi:hypothetical protein